MEPIDEASESFGRRLVLPLLPLHLRDDILKKDGAASGGQEGQSLLRTMFTPHTRSPARIAVEEQLRERREFPCDVWQSRGLAGEDVDWILDDLHRRMEWPNGHFHPDDPLELLLLQAADEYASYELFLDWSDKFKIKLGKEEVEFLCRDGQTIEGLVRELLARSVASS